MKAKRTHVRLFWLEYNRYIPRAIQVKIKSEIPDESHARGKFRPLKIGTSHLGRNKNENPASETSRPLATSSLARPLRSLI